MPLLAPFDPLDSAFQRDPYPIYWAYRTDEPLHANGTAPTRHWHLFRYADCAAALRHPDLLAGDLEPHSIPSGPYAAFEAEIKRQMLFRDPPDHTRLRMLVSKAFTPRTVEQLRPRIATLVATLLEPYRSAGQFDLMAALALPLPVLVIAELIGVPAADRALLKQWSSAMVAGIDVVRAADAPAVMTLATEAALAFGAYVEDLIAVRRRAPGTDLLSGLIAAEERDDRLSVAEVVSMCILLLNAGHETTTNLIGNGVLALLQHPEQFERLRNQPERAEDAVEELLRFDAPVQMTGRVARADLMIGPAMIRRGEGVTMVLGSANRDPEVFSEPEQLDLGRNEGRILSFGHGIHVCLGAPLARLEAQIALPMLLEHFPNLNLVAAPERLQSAIFRGLTELYVAG